MVLAVGMMQHFVHLPCIVVEQAWPVGQPHNCPERKDDDKAGRPRAEAERRSGIIVGRKPAEPRAEEAEDAGSKRGQQGRAHKQKTRGEETEVRQVPALIKIEAEGLKEDEQECGCRFLPVGKVRIAQAKNRAEEAVQQQG